jgi:hypothetical protein
VEVLFWSEVFMVCFPVFPRLNQSEIEKNPRFQIRLVYVQLTNATFLDFVALVNCPNFRPLKVFESRKAFLFSTRKRLTDTNGASLLPHLLAGPWHE